MKKISFVLLICLLSSFINVCRAEEEFDYIEVKAGDTAPFEGLLFTYPGITNALVKVQTKINLVETQKEEELKRVKVNLQSIIDAKTTEIITTTRMYEEQLNAKEEVIAANKREAYLSNIKTVGGIAFAAVAGLAVGFLVGKILK